MESLLVKSLAEVLDARARLEQAEGDARVHYDKSVHHGFVPPLLNSFDTTHIKAFLAGEHHGRVMCAKERQADDLEKMQAVNAAERRAANAEFALGRLALDGRLLRDVSYMVIACLADGTFAPHLYASEPFSICQQAEDEAQRQAREGKFRTVVMITSPRAPEPTPFTATDALRQEDGAKRAAVEHAERSRRADPASLSTSF